MSCQKTLLLSALLMASLSYAADTDNRLCSNPSVLDLTDRGSVTDTPCVVPTKKGLVEGGFGYSYLSGKRTLASIPQIQANLGLPYKTEISVLTPNYYRMKQPNLAGVSATTLDAKHELLYGKNWILSIQALLTLPGGSQQFGSSGTGVNLNTIIGYQLSSKTQLTVELSYGSLTEPIATGGKRYNSFNPSVVWSFAPSDKTTLFAEAFAATQAAYATPGGLYVDFGMFYVIQKNIALEAEFGQRLIGSIAAVNHYVNTGVTVFIS